MIQSGGCGGNHDSNPQRQVQQFLQELARVLRKVKILAVLDIVQYFTAWLEMDPNADTNAKTKSKSKSNLRSSSINRGSSNKSNSSSDATPPQNTNSSAKSLYPQRRSAKYSNKIHLLSAAALSSLLWSQRFCNKWLGPNHDSSSAAWSEQICDAAAIAASLQVNGCGNNNDDCGIIFEDSSAMGESGDGGGKNVLKCQTLGYHHDRSEH
ncbi:hypothetical protein ACA910_006961 [Epithemia clementina (nom. ined.)]